MQRNVRAKDLQILFPLSAGVSLVKTWHFQLNHRSASSSPITSDPFSKGHIGGARFRISFLHLVSWQEVTFNMTGNVFLFLFVSVARQPAWHKRLHLTSGWTEELNGMGGWMEWGDDLRPWYSHTLHTLPWAALLSGPVRESVTVSWRLREENQFQPSLSLVSAFVQGVSGSPECECICFRACVCLRCQQPSGKTREGSHTLD